MARHDVVNHSFIESDAIFWLGDDADLPVTIHLPGVRRLGVLAYHPLTGSVRRCKPANENGAPVAPAAPRSEK